MIGKRPVVYRFELDHYVELRNAEAKAALEIPALGTLRRVGLLPVLRIPESVLVRGHRRIPRAS